MAGVPLAGTNWVPGQGPNGSREGVSTCGHGVKWLISQGFRKTCATGESDLRGPEPEDLAALAVEAAAMAGVPLAGTNWVSGR